MFFSGATDFGNDKAISVYQAYLGFKSRVDNLTPPNGHKSLPGHFRIPISIMVVIRKISVGLWCKSFAPWSK